MRKGVEAEACVGMRIQNSSHEGNRSWINNDSHDARTDKPRVQEDKRASCRLKDSSKKKLQAEAARSSIREV